MDGSNPLPVVLCGVAAGAFLLGSLHLRRKQRLLHDLPTSKTQGVFIGLVEVAGTAESSAPLRGYLSGATCVHFDYEVQEHWSRTVTETYTDKEGKSRTRTRHESGWTTVAHGGETQDFYLRDDTGAVLIRPAGAKVEAQTLFEQTVNRGDPLYYAKGPDHAVANSDHRRRFVERGLALHTSLYVVGQARERADVVAPEIAQDRNAPLFLISTRTERSVQTRLAVGSWVCWALGLVAAVGAALFAMQNLPPGSFAPLAIALGGYLGGWALGWTWMVFNSLVSLRNRVRQAWSLIEVQLKRRHDLLPSLTSVVSALSTHERSTQTAVSALRSQIQATPPGVAGPDFAGVAAALRGVAEAYPELTAQDSFARLQRELVTTEQRIALARSYYNDIATQFATRLERIPDGWVARLAAMKPQPLLAAADFERARVDVQFADAA
ncbi:LemA family protein [Opitutus terrae]|uniref:RING-type E3 ubiquitin transferase n=1 Tax=Opitutus terrae (strain DSM 11246 / JCM 15787 / PB90-1) TaxID=452637 RepID=B1ZSD0_OPITP|nr:LemA family protein [Opitutus terrae]ACB75729.1 LemA family protein [Opitutus terrae PB90-1]